MRSFKVMDYWSVAIVVVWAAYVWSVFPVLLGSGSGEIPALFDSWRHFIRYFMAPLAFLLFAMVTVFERKLTAHECGLELSKRVRVEFVLVGLMFLLGIASAADRQEFALSSGLVAVMLMLAASEIVLRALTISLIVRLFGNGKLVMVAAVIISGLLFLAVHPSLHDRLPLMALSCIVSSYLVLNDRSILLVLMMDAFTLMRHSPIDGGAAVPLLAMAIFLILAGPVWLVGKFRSGVPAAASE